jgi:RHS repeat-associated protein
LINFAGAILELYAFDAYGNAIGFDPSVALTEFLYSGEQFDSKIGQQYLRARYYDPVTGRFNRNDPFLGNVSDPQSLHNYLYCHADPMSYVDPSGEIAIIPILAVLGLLFIGTHAGLLYHFSSTETQTNAEFMPDAAVLGISGSSRKVVASVEQLILGTTPAAMPINVPMPATPLIASSGAIAQLMAKLSQAVNLTAQIGIDIVFNMLSAQMSFFLTVGASVPMPGTQNDSLTIQSGLIWNRLNMEFAKQCNL